MGQSDLKKAIAPIMKEIRRSRSHQPFLIPFKDVQVKAESVKMRKHSSRIGQSARSNEDKEGESLSD